MALRSDQHRLHSAWWTVILLAGIGLLLLVTGVSFNRSLRPYVPVMLTSERSGLVMETGAKVMMRGVQVGEVVEVNGEYGRSALKLHLDPDALHYIPANVGAKIDVTTVFGAKFVDLVYPEHPSPQRLARGAVLQSSNVTTEVNTVFENVVDLLKMVQPEKLNSVLTAVAEAVRGRGEQIGQATTDLNQVLQALNARSDTMREDWRSTAKFGSTYAAAAGDITTILDAASTTSTTVVGHKNSLDTLLLSAIGLSTTGTDLLAESKDNFVTSVNTLAPTTDLLHEYNPVYTCFLEGMAVYLDQGGEHALGGGDGRSLILDATLLFGNEPYIYPDNLPIVAAKGGPGGKPGCGSLPDIEKNFPARMMISNTGFGTGLDWRPNPGLGQFCFIDYFRATRAVPAPVGPRQCLPGPAPKPEPFFGPGTPPYGVPLYGPGGVPLYPNVPPAQPESP
jgi:phospholipid/cholesterol/gamma-HCH transport system substrate-binding protein